METVIGNGVSETFGGVNVSAGRTSPLEAPDFLGVTTSGLPEDWRAPQPFR